MGDNEVVEYLDSLVLNGNVSPRTQVTALNSLSFLYKQIIGNTLSPGLVFVSSKRQPKLPIVMTLEDGSCKAFFTFECPVAKKHRLNEQH